MRRRNNWQKFKDFLTFPLRAFLLPDKDKWGLSSWETERFSYAAHYVRGRCLDVGCGTNRFIKEFVSDKGAGIDVYPYAGLEPENVIENPSRFPFEDGSFETLSFIASLNHISESLREAELSEAHRVLKPGGNVIVTMDGHFLELGAHAVLAFRQKFLGKKNIYHIHGRPEDKIYFLSEPTIIKLLTQAGFQNIQKKYFTTQWRLNRLFIGFKI